MPCPVTPHYRLHIPATDNRLLEEVSKLFFLGPIPRWARSRLPIRVTTISDHVRVVMGCTDADGKRWATGVPFSASVTSWEEQGKGCQNVGIRLGLSLELSL